MEIDCPEFPCSVTLACAIGVEARVIAMQNAPITLFIWRE
jgi:hypothetical protein